MFGKYSKLASIQKELEIWMAHARSKKSDSLFHRSADDAVFAQQMELCQTAYEDKKNILAIIMQ